MRTLYWLADGDASTSWRGKAMTSKIVEKQNAPSQDGPRKLNPAAERALAEAAARRNSAAQTPLPAEVGGREGPDPVRYGDWEVRGIASDF